MVQYPSILNKIPMEENYTCEFGCLPGSSRGVGTQSCQNVPVCFFGAKTVLPHILYLPIPPPVRIHAIHSGKQKRTAEFAKRTSASCLHPHYMYHLPLFLVLPRVSLKWLSVCLHWQLWHSALSVKQPNSLKWVLPLLLPLGEWVTKPTKASFRTPSDTNYQQEESQ